MRSILRLTLALSFSGGMLLACATNQTRSTAAEPSVATHGISFPAGARVVELTHPFDTTTLYQPMPPERFELTKIHCGKFRDFFLCMNKFSAPEHGGTHLDAPVHFAEGHPTVDKIPIQRLVASAVVIDMSVAARANADALLNAGDVATFEKAHGPIERGAIVLVRTDWADRWPDRKRYFGDDKPEDMTNLHSPGIGEDAARIFVQRGVAAVGIDAPSVDNGPSQHYVAHQVLLGADVPMFENVGSLKELPARGALVIALPMLIGGGTGAPLHIIAVLPPTPR